MSLLRYPVSVTLVILLMAITPSALAASVDEQVCSEVPGGCADPQGDSIGGDDPDVEGGGGEPGSDGSDVRSGGTSEPGGSGTSEQGSPGTSGTVTQPAAPSSNNTTGSGSGSGSGSRRRTTSSTSSGTDPSPSPTPSPSPSPTESPSPEPSPTPTEDLAGVLEVDPTADESMLPFYIMLAAIAALMFVYFRGRRKHRGGTHSRGRSPRSFR